MTDSNVTKPRRGTDWVREFIAGASKLTITDIIATVLVKEGYSSQEVADAISYSEDTKVLMNSVGFWQKNEIVKSMKQIIEGTVKPTDLSVLGL